MSSYNPPWDLLRKMVVEVRVSYLSLAYHRSAVFLRALAFLPLLPALLCESQQSKYCLLTWCLRHQEWPMTVEGSVIGDLVDLKPQLTAGSMYG